MTVPVASVAGTSSNVEAGAEVGAVDEAGADTTVVEADSVVVVGAAVDVDTLDRTSPAVVEVAVAPFPPPELHAAINNANAIRLDDSVARDGARTNAVFTNTSSSEGMKER